MKSGDKETYTFMFSSILVAVTCVFFKIVFGYIYALNQFEFSMKLLSKIQYALYKTQWKTYLFLQFQLSTLYIHKDPFFDVMLEVFTQFEFTATSFIFIYFRPNRLHSQKIFFHFILCTERYLANGGSWDLIFSIYQRLLGAVERKRYFVSFTL